jgi:Protein of unknown function (DUF2589)
MADDKSQLKLSQAILAPIDAILKSQVHAARSFLNLVLQIGYPHWPLNKEAQPMSRTELIEIIKEEVLKDTDELEKRKKNYTTGAKEWPRNKDGNKISDDDLKKVIQADRIKEELKRRKELYQMKVRTTLPDTAGGSTGQNIELSIPTLALVPLNPLAIDSAKIVFDFKAAKVEDMQTTQPSEVKIVESDQHDTSGKPTPTKPRPWHLIEPQEIVGNIGKNDGGKNDGGKIDTESSIHIEITLAASKKPAALENMLTLLTQSVQVREQGK